MENIYLKLTKEFNEERLRVIICSGQAVVLHHLAIMSKDGDWMVRENDEAFNHILKVLNKYGASYRFGAPLDVRWMSGGWSAHFEFRYQTLRIRADFFSHPPRLSQKDIQRIWKEQENREIPFLDPLDLAELKKTNREKDYVVIGELARIMRSEEHKILYSRSARDLIQLAKEYPEIVKKLIQKRSVLAAIPSGRSALEKALDAERRELMHINEQRLIKYMQAAKRWQEYWPVLSQNLVDKPLNEMHQIIVKEAEKRLPFNVDRS